MNMHAVDWWIVGALLAVLAAAALATRRYARSVPAFLAANRCGGRYLISVASGIAALGVITLVGYFEASYEIGYTQYWWVAMEGPATIVMALSGWVVYRYRQTRAMTLAQFFEIRYGRGFRVFAGLVAFLSGIINFGIFPSVGARFFIALCGLPDRIPVAGIECSTFALLMAGLLAISLLFVFLGGQIAVMVTDFLQGVFCHVVFAILIVVLLATFPWSRIAETLLAAPEGASLVHPFKLGAEKHFDFWFYLIGVVVMFYGALSWQGVQGYNCAAKSAHEAKMANILAGWRWHVLMLIVIVLPICVRTVLHHPAYTAQAAAAREVLAGFDSETLRTQVRTAAVAGVILPAGLLGLTCAAMLAAFISTHDTYLHSWGSILVQDVILPFRRRSFTPRQHLWLLRGAIFAVAAVIFLFSLLFRHTQLLKMFLALTGSVFVGGAGSAIIGGLYWKRGTAAGAWAAMITGMTLSVAGIVIKQIAPDFFLTGQEMTFYAIAASVVVYALVSLLGPGRGAFDMDRLLHRGPYAVGGETSANWRDARTWIERLGFSREFTRRDRIVTCLTLGWPLAWTLVFLAGTVYNLLADVPDRAWLAFWHGWTWVIFAVSVVVTVWFSIGGFLDVKDLFHRLRTRPANPREDGRVEDHRIVGEDAAPIGGGVEAGGREVSPP